MNFHNLGAISSYYLIDFCSPIDRLDCGTPSDRPLAERHVQGQRGQPAFVRGVDQYADAAPANPVRMDRPGFAGHAASRRLFDHPPADSARLTREDRPLALIWRLGFRELLQSSCQGDIRSSIFCANAAMPWHAKK